MGRQEADAGGKGAKGETSARARTPNDSLRAMRALAKGVAFWWVINAWLGGVCGPQAPAGYEMSRKDQEKKKKEEEEEEEDPDPEVEKRLEAVRKRREAQAKQRIAADGYDRMKPLSADNRPPGSVWPPPNAAPEIS